MNPASQPHQPEPAPGGRARARPERGESPPGQFAALPARSQPGAAAERAPILIVDDEPHVIASLQRLLRSEPYRVLSATDADEALDIIRQEPVQLVMCDHRMPGMTGTELMEHVKVSRPDVVRIMITGYLDVTAAVEAINKGEVFRFVTKPWDDDEVRLIIRQAVQQHRLLRQNRELVERVNAQNRELRQLTRQLERRVTDRTHEIEQKRDELRASYFSTIQALAAAVEAKDPYTRGHSESVARYASLIARALSVTGNDLEGVRVAGILHDIGKLILDDALLSKTARLEPHEWERIRQHPEVGARILRPALLPWPVVPLVYHHHERYDGSGYPDGLKGNDIPLGARILAVADSFDAMNSDRSYRPRLSPREILRTLEEGAGKLFDPEIVRAFFSLVKKDLISV